MSVAQTHLPFRGRLDAHRQSGFRLPINSEPVRWRARRGTRRPILAQHRGKQVHRCLMRVGEMIEHDHDRDTLRGHIQTVTAPTTQCAAMGGDRAAQLARSIQTEAISAGIAVAEGHRDGQAAVRRIRIIARCVNVALPCDHVVEAGAKTCITGPQDTVLCDAEPTGSRTLVALCAVGHGRGVGGQQCRRHAGAVEHARAQKLREASAGALLHNVRQDAKILVHVGVARSRHEMQRARATDHTCSLGIAEWGLDRRAVQHRHRPIVAQARLVMTQMQRAWCRLLQHRQTGAHVGIQHRRIGIGVQDDGAGKLLGDGAHAEQRARREGDAPLGVGPSPCVAKQHLAIAQRSDCTAGSGIGARQRVHSVVEARGE